MMMKVQGRVQGSDGGGRWARPTLTVTKCASNSIDNALHFDVDPVLTQKHAKTTYAPKDPC